VRLTDGSEDYGISESALALLRTLERDHSPGSPLAERLVFHGCGTMLMMGCPIGIDWSVRHESDSVHLDGIVVYPSTNEDRDAIRSDAVVLLPLAEYRSQVLAFAERARDFFRQAPRKLFCDAFDRGEYEQFWREFDSILERQRLIR
jgi:nucleotide-binding universal stress UspA family protein